jgi:membrane-associated protease RseP (regulator of RpoE activity)
MMSSLLLMISGVISTVHSSATALAQFPVVPIVLLKSSFLVGSLLSALAPKIMLLPNPQPVPVHPLVLIGFTGLLANALNMLPVGHLDGGRAYGTIFGSRSAEVATVCTLFLLTLLTFSGSSSLAL